MTRIDKAPHHYAGLDRKLLTDQKVLAAMSRVPRAEFVLEGDRRHAYEDRPLPIGNGQTISQPFMVAFMTQEAKIQPGDRVLEIGTGSGFQAAILAELGAELVTIEIVPALAASARARLLALGYDSITVVECDGALGYPERAPYRAIIVTAAGTHPPRSLLDQLEEDGRMLMPIRDVREHSDSLMLFTKKNGIIEPKFLMYVSFVPFTGREGIEE